MRIGLFFGSFNPIHHGHLIIANHIVNNDLVDQVWFVVSPLNPFKDSKDLISEYIRLHLTSVAIEGMNKFRVVDVEFKLPRPSYTINTLEKLKDIYPEEEFSLIVGGDSYQNIHRWREGSRILTDYKILVYQRKGFDNSKMERDKVAFIEAPLIEISSTEIRKMIKVGMNIRYYVPDLVVEEIDKSRLYRK
jgi:nicotinate-nucleotide adenylyltransferase